MTTGVDTTGGELLVPPGDARDLPAMVRHELARLSLERQEEFLERYRSRRKSRGWAWLLWFLGWHFAYFGQWGLQILYVLSFWGFLVWWVVEAFKIDDRVRQWRPPGTIHGEDSDDRRKSLERCIRRVDGLAEAIGGPNNFGREIDEIIAGRSIRTPDEYLSVSRRCRGIALTRSQRELVWRGYELYRYEVERGFHDWAHLRMRALELASAGAGPRFDAVIVDEAQDLKEVQVRLLSVLDASPNHSNLMFVGDGQQAIYPGGFSLGSVDLDVRGRSFLLSTNWRNTQRIGETAEEVIGDLPFGDIEEAPRTRRQDEMLLPLRLGLSPELHVVHSADEEGTVLELVVSEALEEGDVGDLAVLGRTKKVWTRAEKALRGAGIPTARLDDYRGAPDEGVKERSRRARGSSSRP